MGRGLAEVEPNMVNPSGPLANFSKCYENSVPNPGVLAIPLQQQYQDRECCRKIKDPNVAACRSRSKDSHARCMRALLAGWDACVRARWLENALRQPDNRDSSIQEIPHTLHPGSTPCTRTMRPRAHTHHPGCAGILILLKGVTRGKK